MSHTEQCDRCWVLGMTHVNSGRDGRAHFVDVIECHDRQLLGRDFALRGRAKEAEGVIEGARIAFSGTLRPAGGTPALRSDNGLIIQYGRYRAPSRDYWPTQDCITPHVPKLNSIVNGSCRRLEEDRVWQHAFRRSSEANIAIRHRIECYNEGHPHESKRLAGLRELRVQKYFPVAGNMWTTTPARRVRVRSKRAQARGIGLDVRRNQRITLEEQACQSQ